MRDHQWHSCNVIVAHEPATSQTASIRRTIWRATGETGKDARLSSNCRQFDVTGMYHAQLFEHDPGVLHG